MAGKERIVMGMFDTVVFEGKIPEGLSKSDQEFQTKSLIRMLDQFTITRIGRLIHNTHRYEEQVMSPEGIRRMVPVEAVDVDMEFHGDMVLTSYQGNDYQDFVLRFTHGTLEWVRPLEVFSEKQRLIAVSRCLES